MLQHLVLLLNSPVVIAVILLSGIGGSFQFGYGISVMTSPSCFLKQLMNITFVQRYNVFLEEWQVSLIWSFTISIFSIGGLVGGLSSGLLLSHFGRKRCLVINNFVAICGSVMMLTSRAAMSYEMILLGRFLYGINAGTACPVHTLYIYDCAPKRLKAMVGASVAVFIATGKFCGQMLGLRELLGTEDNWPWLLGFNGFTALFQLLTLPFLPESPSFLLMDRGDQQACEEALRRLRGKSDYTLEVEEMLEEKAALEGVHSHSVWELFHTRAVRWQLLTVLVAFTTIQLTGINAVYLYSFEVFRAAGIPELKLPYVTMGLGLCEVSTSVACFLIIERFGRKILMVTGYMSMAITLILITATLFLQRYISWMPYCSMVLFFFFIFSFSSGPGGVTPPLPGQIFTQSFKPAAFTLAASIAWTGLFVLGMTFPYLVDHLGYGCFLIFVFTCSGCSLFVKFCVPETDNRTVLEIAAQYDKMHGKAGDSQGSKSSERSLQGKNILETKL